MTNDPTFSNGTFSLMGISQGSHVSRYLIEKCNSTRGRIRNFISLGGPLMGVGKVPFFFDGILGAIVNWLVGKIIYTSFIQNIVGPAGYYRDVNQLQNYMDHSIFLPNINGEDVFDQDSYDGFSSLNKLFLGMFEFDEIVYPKESAWFYELQPNGSILPYNETNLYVNDTIGLKKLDKKGKLIFHTFQAKHSKFTNEDLIEYVCPVLKT